MKRFITFINEHFGNISGINFDNLEKTLKSTKTSAEEISIVPIVWQSTVAAIPGTATNYLYNGYSAKIKEEARALAPHLRTIANDTNLKSLLEEFGYASDDSMLEKIRNYANDLDGANGLVNKIEDLSDWFVLTKEDGTGNQEAFTTLINQAS